MTSAGARAASASLQGKVALVTGASRGIGKATARVFAEAGAAVALAARDAVALDANVAEIQDTGGSALACPGDVADERLPGGRIRVALLPEDIRRVQAGGHVARVARLEPLAALLQDAKAPVDERACGRPAQT